MTSEIYKKGDGWTAYVDKLGGGLYGAHVDTKLGTWITTETFKTRKEAVNACEFILQEVKLNG